MATGSSFRTPALVLALGVAVIVGVFALLGNQDDDGPRRATVALVCGVPKSVFAQPARPLPDEPASDEVRRDPSLIGGEVPTLWRMYETDDRRIYIAGEPPSAHATTLRWNGGWKWTSGGGCDTFVEPPGRAAALWAIPREGLDRAATRFTVLVTDRQCASGRPADERVGQATVEETATTITVTFTATGLEGNQNCPGHANATRVVRLEAPIGDRVLLDGGVFPPQPACVVGGAPPQAPYCEAHFYG